MDCEEKYVGEYLLWKSVYGRNIRERYSVGVQVVFIIIDDRLVDRFIDRPIGQWLGHHRSHSPGPSVKPPSKVRTARSLKHYSYQYGVFISVA